jgi:hypothetical protein
LKGEGLIRKANPIERASEAFGAVVQRRRENLLVRSVVRLLDEPEGARLKLRSERHNDARSRAGVIEDTMVAFVPVLAQEETLSHQLDALRLPGSFRVIGNAPTFRFNRYGVGARCRHEIQFRGDAKTLARKRHRSTDPRRLVPIGGFRG